VLSVMK